MESMEFGSRSADRRNMVAFWLLGLLNNSAYVIMIASANGISSSAVGLVYLCAVLPGALLKISAPYWFHKVPYSIRIVVAAALMGGSYITVGVANGRRPVQLAGVVLSSLQGALGEASCLALTSHYNSQVAITMWSSGTGFAGVGGYTWVAMLHVWLGLSFRCTLLAANVTVGAWLATYFWLLERPEGRAKQVKALVKADEHLVEDAAMAMGSAGSGRVAYHSDTDDEAIDLIDKEIYSSLGAGSSASLRSSPFSGNGERAPSRRARAKSSKASRMSARERFARTVALWPYALPLFVVYFGEYAMQSGAWTVIGFPVTDTAARQKFYVYSNWLYQAGVFLSRSSGTVWQAGQTALWVMPAMQLGWLVFFLADAVKHFWYNWGLLVPCFITGKAAICLARWMFLTCFLNHELNGPIAAGLLGGAVYVNAFTLIAREVEPQYREFSLAAVSVADSAGIAAADVAGILIQGCLFKANGLKGADFSC